jgi:cell migration-inducing and hyaluronan-binding protein
MRLHDRLLHLSLVASAFFTVSVQAQEAVSDGRWSDASTWSGGELPEAGDIVTIGAGMEVILDVSPPDLSGVNVEGKLSFSNDSDLELTTEWITLTGELQIGTEARPHTADATITLTNNTPNEDPMSGMGDRGIMISGGTLNLHGNRTNTWTKLTETAQAGSSRIEVLNADQWQTGDEIALASTDYNPRQAETRFITAISGNTITLNQPLDYMHFGEITFDIDERAEVGLLTRNIKVQASEDAFDTYLGGHIMAMPGSRMYVEGVELHRMGQHMTLARYPIHWHLVGEADGQYIRNAAIHDTFNRCVTVHGTHNLRVENNVTYNNVGHCFFLEDGIETGNEFVRNLAIQTKCHPTMECVPTNLAANGEIDAENRGALRQMSFSGEHTLLPSDNTVSSYWITNPDNSFIDNVAAGSDETGFWFSLPEHPNGQFLGTEVSLNTWPRRTPLRAFRGNVAHSNFDGFMFDRNINEDNTFDLSFSAFTPLENPADPYSEIVETHFENLTSYKNRNGGIWGRGELHVFRNVKLADNAIGMTHSTGTFGSERFTSRLIDSLVVGETDNIGNPTTPEEVAYGRSLPKPPIPDFPIRGYEYYDHRDEVVNTTFVNYQDNDMRKTGALSWLLFTSAAVTTESTIEGAEFVNAKPVYFPNIDPRFDNDNRGAVAYRNAVIHDLDGSVGGMGDSYILIHDGENDSVATDEEACKIQPTWNAAVCTGDVGRLYFRAGQFASLSPPAGTRQLRGGFGFGYVRPTFPPAGAARAAPPAPPAPIALVRNGKEFRITGNQSTVRAGTEIRVKTERPEVSLSLSEMSKDSWVIFELPGFANAASGTEQDSMDALRKASETSYFRGENALWVKLVVPEDPVLPIRPSNTQASITIRR